MVLHLAGQAYVDDTRSPYRLLLVEHHGYTCTRVDVDSHGSVRPDDVIAALKPDTVLVSVMHANNEIGTIQRIEAIAEVVHHRRILMHTDAAQSAGYGLIDTSGLDADFVSLSAHKLYGPKGIGALFVRGSTRLTALQTGGGQERGLRAGTLNVPAIVGFGAAAALITTDTVTPPMERSGCCATASHSGSATKSRAPPSTATLGAGCRAT